MFNLPPIGLNAIDPKKNDPTKPIKLPSNDVPNGNQDKGNNSIFEQLEDKGNNSIFGQLEK